MTQRKAWKALIQTKTYSVAGESVLFGKVGTPKVASIVAGHPGTGDVIQIVMDDRRRGRKTTVASLTDAVTDAAEAEGLPTGKVARAFVAALPCLVVDLVVASAVMADDEERAEFRTWVESLNLQGTIDALMAFVDMNFPEAAGPLGDALAKVAIFVQDLPTLAQAMLKSNASVPAPGSEPQAEPQALPAAT